MHLWLMDPTPQHALAPHRARSPAHPKTPVQPPSQYVWSASLPQWQRLGPGPPPPTSRSPMGTAGRWVDAVRSSGGSRAGQALGEPPRAVTAPPQRHQLCPPPPKPCVAPCPRPGRHRVACGGSGVGTRPVLEASGMRSRRNARGGAGGPGENSGLPRATSGAHGLAVLLEASRLTALSPVSSVRRRRRSGLGASPPPNQGEAHALSRSLRGAHSARRVLLTRPLLAPALQVGALTIPAPWVLRAAR